MNDEIESELKNLVINMGLSQELPVAFQNVEFTPPEDGSGFIDFSVVWADNRKLANGDATEYSGRLILVLATPLNVGTSPSSRLAKEVANLFQPDLRIPLAGGGHVRITTGPSIRTGYRDGLYWRTPVVVNFQSMTA